MVETFNYIHLGPREGSAYQQYFVKGRNLRAETLYRAIAGPEPMSPDEVARDYDLPVEAIREAVHYCAHNAALLQRGTGGGLGREPVPRPGRRSRHERRVSSGAMRIYLDDDSASRQLSLVLRKAGHDVSIPDGLGTSGSPDPVHLTQAIRDGRVLLTRNASRLLFASRPGSSVGRQPSRNSAAPFRQQSHTRFDSQGHRDGDRKARGFRCRRF